MSSDTDSTVCDPRLEVAPEPQVPKGPGQIRRVPQLFTATARSTPVVPPQVQQLGSGGWDAKKKAECPKSPFLGHNSAWLNELADIPIGSGVLFERLCHACPEVRDDAKMSAIAIFSTHRQFKCFCPAECAANLKERYCGCFSTCRSELYDHLSRCLLMLVSNVKRETRASDVVSKEVVLQLLEDAFESHGNLSWAQKIECEESLRLTHCALHNIVHIVTSSGPPHFRYGDLVINIEAIINVFNAKSLDPDDYLQSVRWPDVLAAAGIDPLLDDYDFLCTPPTLQNSTDFRFSHFEDPLEGGWLSEAMEGEVGSSGAIFDKHSLGTSAISPPPKTTRYNAPFMNGRVDSPCPVPIDDGMPSQAQATNLGRRGNEHSSTQSRNPLNTQATSPSAMSMHANASRVDGPFREDTPRPSPTYSPGSESPASDDGHCAPPAAGRAASGSTACSSPTIGPTDGESETPMDVETPVGSGTESGDEREDDPAPPKGVAAHRADAAQAEAAALKNQRQQLYNQGRAWEEQARLDYMAEGYALVAHHKPVKDALHRTYPNAHPHGAVVSNGTLWAVKPPPCKLEIVESDSISHEHACEMGKNIWANQLEQLVAAFPRKEVHISVLDGIWSVKMLSRPGGLKELLQEGPHSTNLVMVILSRCAGEIMNVLTQLGYTTVEKWRFANEDVPLPRMPSLRVEGSKPSSRGKLGALMFKRLFALVVGAAVDDILLKADGNGIRYDPVPQGSGR